MATATTTKENNKCFLCTRSIPKTCKGFSSGSWESSFVLSEILGVPHWEKILTEEKNQNLKIHELFYCFKCLGRIMKIKNEVEELKRLEELIGVQKCQIKQDLRNGWEEFRQNGSYFSGKDWHPTDRFKDNIVLELNRNDKTQGSVSLRGKRKFPSSSSIDPPASKQNSSPTPVRKFQSRLLPQIDDKNSVVALNTRSGRMKSNPNPTGISLPNCLQVIPILSPETRDPLLPSARADNILPIPTNTSQSATTEPKIKIKKEVLSFYPEETTNIYGVENASDSETPDFHNNTEKFVSDPDTNNLMTNLSDSDPVETLDLNIQNMLQEPGQVFHVPALTSTLNSKSPKSVSKSVRRRALNHTCQKCGLSFPTHTDFQNHLNTKTSCSMTQQPPSSLQCSVCHLLCVSYYSLKNHIIACHYGQKADLLPSVIPYITRQ